MLPLPAPLNNFKEQLNRVNRMSSAMIPLQTSGGFKLRIIMYRALIFNGNIAGGQPCIAKLATYSHG
jgi:hypothetical protein